MQKLMGKVMGGGMGGGGMPDMATFQQEMMNNPQMMSEMMNNPMVSSFLLCFHHYFWKNTPDSSVHYYHQ